MPRKTEIAKSAKHGIIASFNEAAARCRGKLRRMPARLFRDPLLQ